VLRQFRDTANAESDFGPHSGGIVGAAFGAIIVALIDDVLMPVVELVHGRIDSSKLLFSDNPNSVPVFGPRGRLHGDA